ncbi:MAG: ABC transporter permease [Maricaulaceae bacterium]
MSALVWSAWLNETGAEITKTARAPEFILPTLLMPVAFYGLFGVALAQSAQASAYLLATYGVFSVMGPAIFGFGVAVAQERERGWLALKQASPAPGTAFLAARLVATLLFAAMALILVYAVAGFGAGVALPRATWFALFGVHLLAAVPFVFLGLVVGFLFKANAAVAVSNIVFLGLASLGGLWIPITVLPNAMKALALGLPSFHLGELALATAGASGDRPIGLHIGVALTMSLAFAGLALWAWRRQTTD